jgi:tRNA pseudouridine55 synthase
MSRSGILLVDKPAGISSAEITNQLKKHKLNPIGHGGTLDPFATGLMVVLVGEATKIARFLLEGTKEYEAEATLGVETETGDHTGNIVSQTAPPDLSLDKWNELARQFVGNIQQTPPIYSAIKVDGRPLYEYARRGQKVEIKSRSVQIHSLEVLEVNGNKMRFRVSCGGGTYIRVLANDLAKAAGTTAHLHALRRTASSSFRVEKSLPLSVLLEMPTADLPFCSLEEALSHFPKVHCNAAQAVKVRQGNLAVFDELREQIKKPGFFLVLTQENNKNIPVAMAVHNPTLLPYCSLERVFDPKLLQS